VTLLGFNRQYVLIQLIADIVAKNIEKVGFEKYGVAIEPRDFISFLFYFSIMPDMQHFQQGRD